MQELFAELFWENEEVSHAVVCLCDGLPGYKAARAEYDKILSRVQALTGYELCNELQERLAEYSRYEEYAYYAVGLGLRETVFRALCG